MNKNPSEQYLDRKPFLEKIKRRIESYQMYLLKHLQYIKEIEAKNIPEDEVLDYLADVFDFIKINQDEIALFIPKLKEVVIELIKTYQELKEACLVKNSDYAMCLLYILLERTKLHFSYRKALLKIDIDKMQKTQAVFQDKEFIHFLYVKVGKNLPDIHQELSKIIFVKVENTTTVNKITGTAIIEIAPAIQVSWAPVLRVLLANIRLSVPTNSIAKIRGNLKKKKAYENKTGRLTQNNYDQTNENNNNQPEVTASTLVEFSSFSEIANSNLSSEEKEKAEIFYMLKLIRTFQKENRAMPYKNEIEFIKANLDFYFNNREHLAKINQTLTKIAANMKADDEFNVSYIEDRKYIMQEINKLSNQCDLQLKQIENLSDNFESEPQKAALHEAITQHKNQLREIKVQLQELSSRWPEKKPEKMNSQSELHELYFNSQEFFKASKSKLKNLKNTINEYQDKLNRDSNEVKLSTFEKHLQESAEIKKQRRQYFVERDNKCYQYREQVEKKRQEKIAESKKTALQGKPLKSPSEYIKNLDMEKTLEELSTRHFKLLRKIVKCEKGVSYNEFYYLFINQLHGTISQIGNGSSHYRIKIQNYYTEFITHTYKGIVKETTTTVSTGGMFVQGEKQRSNELCRFNLKLLNLVLAQAGINERTLDELEDKRSQRQENISSVSP